MRSAYPDDLTIRPRVWPVGLIVGGVAALAALVIAGAFRTEQPLAAWFGVAMLIGCAPVADWLLRSIRISPDAITIQQSFRAIVMPFNAIRGYGTRQSWSHQSGAWTYLTLITDRARLDIPIDYFRRDDRSRLLAVLASRVGPSSEIGPPPVDWLVLFAAGGALIAMFVSLVCASMVLPSTLSGERLFSEGAAVGAILGLVFGAVLARRIRRAPLGVGALAAVTLLCVSGSAVLVFNLAGTAEPARTVPVRVESKRWYSDHGRRMYIVDLSIDGTRKRLFPDEAGWQRLATADTFDGCVRDGRLGFGVILRVTRPCSANADGR